MATLQLYDHLLQFQLFQGLSRAELLQLAGNTRFGFTKMPAGKIVVREGDTSQQLFFLIKGELTVLTQADDRGYTVEEQLSAPWLLQPECLFGANNRYSHMAKTATESQFITLSKDEVLRMLDDFLIVRLNYLNLLATRLQRTSRQPWRRCQPDLRQRIIHFFLLHSVYPAGTKVFRILMTRLADELNDSRLNVSRILNALQEEHLLVLQRGRIIIPSLERLLM